MTARKAREQIVALVPEARAAGARPAPACAVLGLSERTLPRWQAGETVGQDQRPLRPYQPPHPLTAAERAEVLAVANATVFGHWPPRQSVPQRADLGRYLASESTFYRILKVENPLTHRRRERPAPARSKPKAVCATAPNPVYRWAITYLPTTSRGQCFYRYRFLDRFSRKLVGWPVYEAESSVLASGIMRDSCQREGVPRHQLLLHADNGGPMQGATMLATLQSLGVMPSFSRPAVSNDNPCSESLFKTLKYRPDYPLKPFANVAAARQWVAGRVEWYHHEHRPSAIRFVTPAQRHAGLDESLLEQRRAVYEDARRRNPPRWRGATRNWQPIAAVHLNPANQRQRT
jgi:transposase InsO family protein